MKHVILDVVQMNNFLSHVEREASAFLPSFLPSCKQKVQIDFGSLLLDLVIFWKITLTINNLKNAHLVGIYS